MSYTNNIFFKSGHETGFAVAHFLAMHRKAKAPISPPKYLLSFSVPVGVSGGLARIVMPLNGLFRREAGDCFQKQVLQLAKEGEPEDLLQLSCHHICERDAVSLRHSFVKVVHQIGWQSRSDDFEGHASKLVQTPPQVFLQQIPDAGVDHVREWAERNDDKAIAGSLLKTAEKLGF